MTILMLIIVHWSIGCLGGGNLIRVEIHQNLNPFQSSKVFPVGDLLDAHYWKTGFKMSPFILPFNISFPDQLLLFKSVQLPKIWTNY